MIKSSNQNYTNLEAKTCRMRVHVSLVTLKKQCSIRWAKNRTTNKNGRNVDCLSYIQFIIIQLRINEIETIHRQVVISLSQDNAFFCPYIGNYRVGCGCTKYRETPSFFLIKWKYQSKRIKERSSSHRHNYPSQTLLVSFGL